MLEEVLGCSKRGMQLDGKISTITPGCVRVSVRVYVSKTETEAACVYALPIVCSRGLPIAGPCSARADSRRGLWKGS